VWTGFTIDPSTHIAVFQYGPFFWILLIYTYALILIGLGLLFRASSRFPARYRSQQIFIMLGALLPVFLNFVYLFGSNPIPGFDWSLIGFLFASAALSFSISRTPLFSLVPLARDLVLENMYDGIIVIDQNGFIADTNPSARQILDLKSTLIGEPAAILARFGVSTQNPTALWPSVQELTLTQPNERTIEVSQTKISGKGLGQAGILLILHEITLRKRAEQALQELNHNLEGVVEERTTQLQETVHRLEDENRVRMQVENELTSLRDTLVNRVLEQGHHLSAIYDIILSSGQSTDAQQLLGRTLDKICELFHCEAGCIHQYNEDTSLFHLSANSGLDIGQIHNLATLPGTWLKENLITYVCVNTTSDSVLPEPLRLAGYTTVVTGPIQLRGQINGTLTIFWTAERSLPVDQIALFTVLADQIRIMMENISLQERIEQAAVRQERRRMARDLHDSVTQSLHSLVLASDTASYRLSQGKMERLSESLAHIAESARQALKDMRLLLYELRLVKLEEIHLEEAIETRLESVERRTGIIAEFRSDGDIDWPPGWQGQSYAIVMEALNNSLKYARATALIVEITKNAEKILVRVEDNGVGFIPQNHAGGIGLKSMSERAEQLGGNLEINSRLGLGTRIVLTLDPHANPTRKIR
jgi:signal transduction histidine kinase